MSLGAALGLAAGAGLMLALTGRLRPRPTLAGRVDPWVAPRPAARAAPAGPPADLVRQALTAAARRIDEVLGGSASVRRRLVLAGEPMTLEQLRRRQVLAGALGLIGGLALLVARGATGLGPPPLAGLALTVAAVVAGVLGTEWQLGRQVTARGERISAELPAVAELLALAVAAGAGLSAGLERVARRSGGDLGHELQRALAQVRTGTPLARALAGVTERTPVTAVDRLMTAIVTALDRGTPLAAVLRAQAADAREASRRELLAAGGRKEVQMLLPVVFLILPTVVLFAVWPALSGLTHLTG